MPPPPSPSPSTLTDRSPSPLSPTSTAIASRSSSTSRSRTALKTVPIATAEDEQHTPTGCLASLSRRGKGEQREVRLVGVQGAEPRGAQQDSSQATKRRLDERRQRKRVSPPPPPHDAPSTSSSSWPRATTVDSSRWMSRLPDSYKLDELYIPGTHESLALFFPLLPSRCQSTSLTSQLNSGIRFLDLRFSLLPSSSPPLRFARTPRGEEDEWELLAYHSVVPQLKRAREVFEEVYRWLESDEGRGETVICSCKQENATPSDLFASTLWSLLDERPDLWYTDERWPSLGEVRGKCVMFCRFYFDGRGLHPPIWPNDHPTPWTTEIGKREVVVQDWYGLPSIISIPQKASLVLSLFSPSALPLPPAPSSYSSSTPPSRTLESDSNRTSLPLRLNFLSSSRFPFSPPSRCAKGFGLPQWRLGFYGVNELVLAGLRRLRGGGEERVGYGYREGEGGMVMMLDFHDKPGGLVEEVVAMNFM